MDSYNEAAEIGDGSVNRLSHIEARSEAQAFQAIGKIGPDEV